MSQNESPFSKNLAEFADAPDPKTVRLTKGVLKQAEIPEVQGFLSSLGSLDSDTQIFELEVYKEKFSAASAAAAEKSDKLSAMYIKLGFFLGLALGIVLL